jgi:surface antigen
MQDVTPLDTIKKAIIEMKAGNDDAISLDAIDISASQMEIQGFDRSRTGIQTVSAKISLTENSEAENTGSKTVGYSFIQNAAVQMVKTDAPQLKLKADSVTVNNGDAWNEASYISYINDDSGIIPVLKVDGNVDMNTDGDYKVTYTVIDIEGNKTSADLTVMVRTPEEVIRAREEAERLAAEEAAREAERLAQEQAEKEEAERRAAEEARRQELEAQSAGSGYVLTGSSNNPYYGGWSNCVYGAWQLAHDLSGVNLPSWGYAGSWLYSAQASGYATGLTPVAGSIAVYSGHVAYVYAVNGDMVYIMEGGFNGGYNERWVNKDYIYGQYLIGYIYLP